MGFLSSWRKVLRQRPPETTPTAPRANPDRIAVLEHDVLGITPEPGTPAARAVALSKPVDKDRCPHNTVIETAELGQARPTGLCRACGSDMVTTDEGGWERP